jgi:hypothetical protein
MRYFGEGGEPLGKDDEEWYAQFSSDIATICRKLVDHRCGLTREEIIKLAIWEVSGDAVAKGDTLTLDSFNMTTLAVARGHVNTPGMVRLLSERRGKRK